MWLGSGRAREPRAQKQDRPSETARRRAGQAVVLMPLAGHHVEKSVSDRHRSLGNLTMLNTRIAQEPTGGGQARSARQQRAAGNGPALLWPTGAGPRNESEGGRRHHPPPTHSVPKAFEPATAAEARPDFAGLDVTDQRPLKEVYGSKGAMPTLEEQAAAVKRLRDDEASGAAPNDGGLSRSSMLLSAAARAETFDHALSTQDNYKCAIGWWERFVAYICLPVQILNFVTTGALARHLVTSIALQFLAFVHPLMAGKDGPAKAESATTYWSQIKLIHDRMRIDLSAADGAVKRWEKGTDRIDCETHGPRRKKKKAMFSVRQLLDVYASDWSPWGGKVNPVRRIKVMMAIPALAIAGLFRASELLRARNPFNPKVAITRDHVTYYEADEAWTPVEPTKANLQRLLRTRSGRAKVRIPKLKNDNLMKKEWDPVSLTFADSPLCALTRIIDMEVDDPMPDRAQRAEAPLFADPERSRDGKREQFSKSAFATVFMGLIAAVLLHLHGIEMSKKEVQRLWSMHSFRITGCNLMRQVAPPWVVKRAGRWLSDCYEQYGRDDLQKEAEHRVNMWRSTSAAADVELPGAGTYPYPKTTLDPSLPMAPPARTMAGPGTFKVTAKQEKAWTWEGAYEREATQSTRELYAIMTEGPEALEGRRVRKKFGSEWFEGTVSEVDTVGVDGVGNALVTYTDGDTEHLDFGEIYLLLIPEKVGGAQGKPKRRRKK